MFFLGLLSTPLPYLLLAAFYFFGFAMGMFNNGNEDKVVDRFAAITLTAEIKPKTVDHSSFYFRLDVEKDQTQCKFTKPEADTSATFFDICGITLPVGGIKIKPVFFSGFYFSRPPPNYC